MSLSSYFSLLGQATVAAFWIPLFLWTGTAIVLLICLRIWGKRHPLIRYHAAMALLLSLPLGFAVIPLVQAGTTAAGMTNMIPVGIGSELPVLLESQIELPSSVGAEVQGITEKTTNPREASVVNRLAVLGFMLVLAALMSLIGLVLFLKKIIALYLFQFELKPAVDKTALGQLEILQAEAGLKRKAVLMHGPADLPPLTFGWRKPVIVVPEHLIEEPAYLRIALRHEIVHLQHSDFAKGLLVQLLGALLAFHPLVWLLVRQINIDRELACDARVLQSSDIRKGDYARLLMQFTAVADHQFAVPMISRKSTLKRIKAISQCAVEPSLLFRKASFLLLAVILLVPGLLMSCTSDQERMPVDIAAEPGVILLEDIGLSVKLPDEWEWVSEQSIRMTAAEGYEQRLNSVPADVRHIFEIPEPDDPDKLILGNELFLVTDMNVGDVTEDDIVQIISGERTFYRMSLSIRYDGMMSEERLALWREGRCKYSGTVLPCKRPSADFPIIKIFTPREMPFEADAGYLYEGKFRYGNQLDLHTKQLTYYFYAVKGDAAYEIRLTGYSTNPDISATIESEAFLDVLKGIRFI